MANQPSLFSLAGWKTILSAVASGGIAFAFTGFKHGVELAGEAKKSSVSIPLAIVGSVFFCLLLYIGLQVAFIGALDPSMIANGWENLHFTGDAGPFAGLVAGIGLIWLLKLLYIDAAVSPSGTGLIYVTSTARILYAMGQVGFLPRFLTYLNKHKLPVVAIFVNFSIGMLLFLPFPGWQSMVNFLVSGMVLSYAMGPISLLCLRLDFPDKTRPFRLPATRIICFLAFYFCNLMSYWTGWSTMYKLGIAILIGLVFFIGACFHQKWHASQLGLKSAFWIGPYLIGLMMISYLGAFGGKNLITFGWDFIVLAVFSAIILLLAIKNRAGTMLTAELIPTSSPAILS